MAAQIHGVLVVMLMVAIVSTRPHGQSWEMVLVYASLLKLAQLAGLELDFLKIILW